MNPNNWCKADLAKDQGLWRPAASALGRQRRHPSPLDETYWPVAIRMPLQRSRGVTAVQHREYAFYIEFLGMGRVWVGSQANS